MGRRWGVNGKEEVSKSRVSLGFGCFVRAVVVEGA